MPETMRLLRDVLSKILTEVYEKNQRIYNTHSRHVQFKEGQIICRKNFRLSNMAENYNAKLTSSNNKCLVTKVVGNYLYGLSTLSGKKLDVYHVCLLKCSWLKRL